MNAYGTDISASGAGAIADRIRDVEGLNSDGDPTGSDNITEINANTQPGWAEGDAVPTGVTGDLDPVVVVNDPPVADPNGPYSGIVGVAVQFDGSGSTDSDGSIVSYAWDFGDSGTGSGVAPSHTYANPGSYTVTLTVTDDDAATGSATTTAQIDAINVPPVADAGGDYTGTINVALSFDGTGSSDADGTIVSYAWDFGDSGTGTGATPTHTYTATGVFTVTLTVTDDENSTGTDTATATIGEGNQAPTADPGGPYTGTVDIAVNFDGTGSSDPDGTIDTYDWDFGDGTIVMDAGPTPTHTYTSANTYSVTLTVTDNEGAPDSADTTATIADVVENLPPVADANGPYTGDVNVPVAFDGSDSSDPDGTIVSYDWDFGDGNTGTGVAPSHTYLTGGTFTVSLTVTDDLGATGTATTTADITGLVINAPPVADANGPYSGVVGVDVQFDGSGSSDSDGTIVSYEWDFGDGTTGTGEMPAHAYAAEGVFDVILTVTDDDGDTGTDETTATIVVDGNLLPIADAGGPYEQVVDEAVNFDGTRSTDPDGTIVSYDWDFGDGNTGTGATPSHTYTATGLYTVTLTVTDDGGDTGTDTTTATIMDGVLPPVANAGGPYTGIVGTEVAFDGSGSSDPDGTIVAYDWNFGDGTVLMDAGPTPTHTYMAADTYNVTLTVTDDDDLSDSETTTAAIDDDGEIDADVFLNRARVPSALAGLEGRPVSRTILVLGDGDTIEQDATVTLSAESSFDGVEVSIDPASVTETVTPGGVESRFDFEAEITCEEEGDFELEWTMTITAAENADPTNDTLVETTSVLCRGSGRSR